MLDALAFIAAVLAVAFLPGYLLLRLLRLEAHESALLPVSALASLGAVTAASAFMPLLGIPFDAYTYAAMLAVLATAFFLIKPALPKIDYRKLSAFSIPSALLLLVLAAGFSGFITPPHGDDASNHCIMIKEIIEGKSTQLSPWYNTAFHSAAALAIEYSGFPLHEAPFYLVMLLAALLPLSVAFFTTEVSGSERLGLAAAFTSTLFYFFPYHPFMWGGWPTIAAVALLPAALALALRALKPGSRFSGALAGIAFTGILYLHAQELITGAIIVSVLAAGAMLKNKRGLRGFDSLAVTAAVFLLLSAPGLFGAAMHSPRTDELRPESIGIEQVFSRIVIEVLNLALNPMLAFLFTAGVAVSLRENRFKALLALQAFFLALFYTASTTTFLATLVPAGSWAMALRLEYIQIYFVSFFAAAGFNALAGLLKERGNTLVPRFAAAAILFALIFSAYALAGYSGYLRSLLDNYSAVTGNDIEVMEWAQANLPRSSAVLIDGTQNASGSADGGAWFPVFTDVKCVRYASPNDTGCPSCNGFGYVFIGEKLIDGRSRSFNATALLAEGDYTIAVRRGDSLLLKAASGAN